MKQKFLILSDLNASTSKIIKSSISLAKIVDAEIDFFYVKKPTEVVEKESQLSAMRTINKEYFEIDKKIKNLLNPISKEYNIKINHSFSIGNIKNEIEKYIDNNKPDVIVLGKRRPKIINFMGDYITPFILKKHKGIIVIADDKNTLEPNKELSLGFFNDTKANNAFTNKIIDFSDKNLRSYKIAENSSSEKKETFLNNKKIIEYVFEKGDDAIKNISNYLSKSNVNLLFVDRKKEDIKPNIKDVINTINCTLILTN